MAEYSFISLHSVSVLHALPQGLAQVDVDAPSVLTNEGRLCSVSSTRTQYRIHHTSVKKERALWQVPPHWHPLYKVLEWFEFCHNVIKVQAIICVGVNNIVVLNMFY